ncbi:hypothetical protein [uncultured Massilia sp.]|uniref:hypothetical protein n=1 Tax=uncultured Massilia sp. TaxID=169973 RepID=UPI002590C803|nr:hypothetical protein [uncultured Massilia sp.]
MPFDPIPASEQLIELIGARTDATEIDILAGRTAVVDAVAKIAGSRIGDFSLRCEPDEAAALVRATMLGGSALVGARIAGIVNLSIYEYVLPLAQADLDEMERSRRESADELRVDAALDAKAA